MRIKGIIYNKRRNLASSYATTKGYLIIGVRDNPSRQAINETIKHEKAHLEEYTHRTRSFATPGHFAHAISELQAYKREKARSTPRQWNHVLPTRIHDFMNYISWLSKKEQQSIRIITNKTLSPKKDGNNLLAIQKAKTQLNKWWL